METKPYAIQSPEDIAKEYGGNKQRIAQAAQIGLLDPTAAVLAGMFIDRMRGAQSQEQAPQRTVAQQVLAPQPSMPAGAGLGATPEAAQLAAAYPAEGAPPPVPGPSMPQEPVMAADGGLMSLPIDDSMFEPSYNSGGIVAFAAGSEGMPVQGEGVIAERERERLRQAIQARAAAISDPTARAQFLNQVIKLSPDEQRVALGEIALAPVPSMSNVEGTPLVGSPGVVRGEGLTVTEGPAVSDVYPDETVRGSRASMAAPPADAAAPPVSDVYPDETVRGSRKGLVAIAPGASQNRGVSGNAAGADARVAAAAVDADPAAAKAAVEQGGIPGLRAHVQQFKELMGAIPEGEGLKEYKEYLKNLPGELDKRKKEDLWGALTQFGFNLAGSQSPYFLQAAGQAGAQTMPAITGAIKERRSAEAEARKARAELDKMTRAEEIKAVEGGVKLYGDEQTRFNQAEIARLNREAQLQAARYAADKPTDMRSYVADAVAAARAGGDKETPDAVLRQRAVETYLNLYGAAGARASAAQTQASTAADAAAARIQDSARDNVDKSLAGNWNSPENKRIRDLQKADREANKKSGAKPGDANYQDSVTPYRDSLYSAEEARLRKGSGAPAPAPAPAASARPPAAAPAAAPQSKFAVTAPNGRVYYFQTKEQADAFAKSFAK